MTNEHRKEASAPIEEVERRLEATPEKEDQLKTAGAALRKAKEMIKELVILERIQETNLKKYNSKLA